MPLPRSDPDSQDNAVTVADQVDLGAEAPLGTSQRMILRFLDLQRLRPGQYDWLPRIFFRSSSDSARADDGRFRLSEFEAELIEPEKDGTNSKPRKLKFSQAVADAAEEKSPKTKSDQSS